MGGILLHGTLGDTLLGGWTVEKKILGSWSPPMVLIPFTKDPLGNLGMFLIPSMILGTAMAAATMRLMRTMMLEVLRQDYIRTAWSKGLVERLVRHEPFYPLDALQ